MEKALEWKLDIDISQGYVHFWEPLYFTELLIWLCKIDHPVVCDWLRIDEEKASNVYFNSQMKTIRAIALLLIWNSLPGHLPEAIPHTQPQVGLITGMEITRALLYTHICMHIYYIHAHMFKIEYVKGSLMSREKGEERHYCPQGAWSVSSVILHTFA